MKKICTAITIILFSISCQEKEDKFQNGFIYTVNGKKNIETLDLALTHEHVMSTFGADPNENPEYDSVSVFNQVIPYLTHLKSLGISTIFDCTAAYFGRDARLLKSISDSTGVEIITNTGYYGAFNALYVPPFAFEASEAEISEVWINEFENGIGQSEIKPGFIKLGFDSGEPTDIDLKLFRAGILTHLSTGLTIVVHTGNNLLAAKSQLEILEKKKVSPNAWVWAHANLVEDLGLLLEAAEKDAWISLDGVKQSNIQEYIIKLDLFKENDLLHKVLLSHDGNSYPRGNPIRHYEAIVVNLIPELQKIGYTQEEIQLLMVKNPQEAFKIRTRPMEHDSF